MAKTPRDDSFLRFVLERLDALPALHARAMFGGHGLSADGRFFAIVYQGRLYFKTDEAGRADYVEWRMDCFQPNPRQRLKNDYEVPVEILEGAQLMEWARRVLAGG